MKAVRIDPALLEVRNFISENYGIHFAETRLPDLFRKIDLFAAEAGFRTIESCTGALLRNSLQPEHLTLLIESLTVGETYFFREQESIEALGRVIIPEILEQGGRQLRIWSAGCASGEEPYSLAMFLTARLHDRAAWNLSILATDINASFLAKAAQGRYSAWSFRTIPAHYKNRFFTDAGRGVFELHEAVRRMVTFRSLNLVEDRYPSPTNGTHDLDVIFCRNVLMYFAPDMVRAIARRFAECLKPGGWLIVGQTEYSDYFTADFETVPAGGTFLYRKKMERTGETVPPPVVPRLTKSKPLPEPDAHAVPAKRPRSAPEQESAPRLQAEAGDPSREARLLADQGRLEEACVRCEQGIKGDSLNIQGHYLHAVILEELGRLDEARRALRRVLFLRPEFIMGHYSLGRIEQRCGNRREALRHFDNAGRMLGVYANDDILPEAEGLTAGRLKEFLAAVRKQ